MALPGILRRLLEHINTKAAHGLAAGRKFSVSGGATAAPVTFHGTEDVNLEITSLDMSKVITSGALPIAMGGTGRDDGKSPAWTEPRTLTLYGDVLGAAAFDGSANIDLVTRVSAPVAPRPQTTAGVGQWHTAERDSKGRIYLPAGGTWAWIGFTYVSTSSGGDDPSYTYMLNGIRSGVAAGGAELGTTNYLYCLFAWRIA